MPCCSKELSPLPAFFLSLRSRQTFQRRWERDVEGQTAGRAVTITPFRSIQTFWGGGDRREKEKGRQIKWEGRTNSLHDTGQVFRLEYTMCLTAGWGNVKRHGLGERVSGRPCEKAREKELCMSTWQQWKEKMGKEWAALKVTLHFYKAQAEYHDALYVQ